MWFTYFFRTELLYTEVKQPRCPDTKLGLMALFLILMISHIEKKVSSIEYIFPFIVIRGIPHNS